MFYERFIHLCDENLEKPTNVLKSIGVSSGNLKNWKNGTSVKSDILMQISEHFNVSIDYLLGRTNDPETNQTLPASTSDEMSTELLKNFNMLSTTDKARIIVMIDELKKGA